jgi:hypothetical protein
MKDGPVTRPGAKKSRRYTPADISVIRRMRARGDKWKPIAELFGTTEAAVKNAVLYRDGASGAHVPDVMPRAIKAWPVGVDFTPDELQVFA